MGLKLFLLLMALIFVSVGPCMGSDDTTGNATEVEIVEVSDLNETMDNVTEVEIVEVSDLNETMDNVIEVEIVEVSDLNETMDNVTEVEIAEVSDLNETMDNITETEAIVVVEAPEAVKDVETSVEAAINLTENSSIVNVSDSCEVDGEYMAAYKEGYMDGWLLANSMGQLSGLIDGMGIVLEPMAFIAPFAPETYNGMVEAYNDAVDQYNSMALMSNLLNAMITEGNETIMDGMWLEEKDYMQYYYY